MVTRKISFGLLVMSFLWLQAFMGCKRIHEFPQHSTNERPIINEWKDNPYKLNVVYFFPNDMDTLPDYQRRISGILLQLQKFYAHNLAREGFGRKSFGLDLLTTDSVNILTIQGNQGKSAYPYDGGAGAVMQEIDTYFEQHPDDKKSDHILVIMPSVTGNPLDPGGVPFYGIGRTCFALDYPTMDTAHLGQPGIQGDLATTWIGGLAHELGHGLNAPHNRAKMSEDAILGTSLMGTGNGTYGRLPTFITAASAAHFANSQTFSRHTRSDWYEPATIEIRRLKGEVSNGNMIIAGKYESSNVVKDISVYHDRHPAGGNQDYDAVAWNVKPIGIDSFYVVCPISDLEYPDGDYELRVIFHHENGATTGSSYTYNFVNGVPDLSVINTKELLDRSGWQVLEVSSQESTNLGEYVLDGDTYTTWHTQWRQASPSHPHHIVVDLGQLQEVAGFAFKNSDGGGSENGCIHTFELFGSLDNITWGSLGQFELERIKNWQYVDLPTAASLRYVKIMVNSSHGGFHYTHLAELGAFY